jgi:hypothetical protein
MGADQVTYGQGNVVAYGGGSWALWTNVWFIMQSGEPSLAFSGGTGLPPYIFGSSAGWTLGLAVDTTTTPYCLSATVSGSSSLTVHWLFTLDCLDIG